MRFRSWLAAILRRWAAVLEPSTAAMLAELREQVDIAIQLQGVDDRYRVRRVLLQVKKLYPHVPDGDIIVPTQALLAAAPRRPVLEIVDRHSMPAGLRRRRI